MKDSKNFRQSSQKTADPSVRPKDGGPSAADDGHFSFFEKCTKTVPKLYRKMDFWGITSRVFVFTSPKSQVAP